SPNPNATTNAFCIFGKDKFPLRPSAAHSNAGALRAVGGRATHDDVSRGAREKSRRAYEVKYTFGVEPLQQYLVDIGDGHLQAIPFAYDTRPKERGGGRWYHLYANERITPGDEFHWSAPAYNWNKNCADCHSTDMRKNY